MKCSSLGIIRNLLKYLLGAKIYVLFMALSGLNWFCLNFENSLLIDLFRPFLSANFGFFEMMWTVKLCLTVLTMSWKNKPKEPLTTTLLITWLPHHHGEKTLLHMCCQSLLHGGKVDKCLNFIITANPYYQHGAVSWQIYKH